MNPYNCNNAPRPSADLMLPVQDGWDTVTVNAGQMTNNHPIGLKLSPGQQIRVPRMKIIPFRNSVDCQYDKGETDPRCAGCKHINTAFSEPKLIPLADYLSSMMRDIFKLDPK